ncbi:MAG: YkgJ family cysteine cluster protein [Pirellulaceae bacterium]
MSKRPWYREGLRFQCTGCGDCCTGAPGYVWVNKEEIEALASAMGYTDLGEFEQQYVRQIGIRRSLREHPNNYDCVLLDPVTRKCRAYQARPRQCRTWPFWDSNVESAEAWDRTCQVCPGSGQGKLYQLADIETQRRVIHV